MTVSITKCFRVLSITFLVDKLHKQKLQQESKVFLLFIPTFCSVFSKVLFNGFFFFYTLPKWIHEKWTKLKLLKCSIRQWPKMKKFSMNPTKPEKKSFPNAHFFAKQLHDYVYKCVCVSFWMKSSANLQQSTSGRRNCSKNNKSSSTFSVVLFMLITKFTFLSFYPAKRRKMKNIKTE